MADAAVWFRAFVTCGSDRISFQSTEIQTTIQRAKVPHMPMEGMMKKELLGAQEQMTKVRGYAQGIAETNIVKSIANQTYLPIQIHAPNAGPGDDAMIMRGAFANLAWNNTFGEVRGWEADLAINDGIQALIGKAMWNTVLLGTAVTGATSSTPVELPALAAGTVGRFVFAVPNPDPITGTSPTLDGTLQSDVDATFASPTNRGTLTQVTSTAAYQLFELDGDTAAITDTFWRFNISAIGGSGSPSFHILAAGAIMPKVA